MSVARAGSDVYGDAHYFSLDEQIARARQAASASPGLLSIGDGTQPVNQRQAPPSGSHRPVAPSGSARLAMTGPKKRRSSS